MNKELEEAIERLNDFSSITVLYGNTFAMHTEQLEQIQKDIQTLIQIAENSISREVIEKKLTELKREYKEALETNSTKAFILKCQIEILQELLEK